ncbi:hypothetical protein SAMN04489712_104534 [Thermomonospora echinospora]|uniref:Tetratricopeptide repeat-containing protein n=1 Tax=Thermomonospora echinospora TaxID=1992 RepID=A0A1H5ZGF4_9ACTN|nr:hypothetical protein [Thermomonospora echinospora]SEG35160.1 hypothetical protein SAMN04489712_104534 [Thermomonospora echinospora]
MSTDDVYALVARAGDLPYGEARTVLVEDALRRAEAAGDDALAYRVRMELTSAYQHGGEPAKMFTTFTRCLSQHDADPGRFGSGHRLLWHFKWIVNSLTLFPEIPLDRTYAVLDDMERRYRLGGHSMQAVYHYRHVVVRHVGDDAAADEWFAKWHAAPRDELSDCQGCDPTGKVRHLTGRGRHEEALAIAAPVLSAELNCTEQPQSILTALLPAYLRTGQMEEAGRAHRRAYRLVRANLRDLTDIADHLEFCALTGNQARGLEIVQRHLGWLDRAPSPYAAMRFAAASALVLRRLAEAGADEGLPLSRPDGRDVPAAELRDELTAQALTLAERFDARNGSSRQGERIRAVLEAEPIVEHLPLTPYARRPTPVPEPVRAPEPTEPTGPDALLDAAEKAWTRRDMTAALAAWHRFDELVPEPTPAQAGRRADGTGFERMAAGDAEGALAEWDRAAGLHTQAGDEARAQNARSRTGSLLCAMGRADEGMELLTSSLARLDALAPGSRRAVSARLRLADAHVNADRGQEALAVLAAARPTDALDAAEVEMVRARALARLGDMPETVSAFRRACAAFRELGGGGLLAETAFMLAQVLMGEEAQPPEDPSADEALALLEEAIANAPAGQPGLRASVYAVRGNRLTAHGRHAEAVEDLVEAVAVFTAEGAYPQAAYSRLDLTVALLNAERHFEAAEVAEEAWPMLTRLQDTDAEHRCRYLLAQAQEMGEEEEAAETYTGLARDEEHPGLSAQLLEKAADVLTGADKDALAAERYVEAAEAFAAAGDPYGVVRTRRRHAMCLMWSGRLDDGLREMGVARAALGDLPEENPAALTWETAVTSYDEARLLANAGRTEEALARLEESIQGFTELDEHGAAATAAEFRDQLTAE